MIHQIPPNHHHDPGKTRPTNSPATHLIVHNNSLPARTANVFPPATGRKSPTGLAPRRSTPNTGPGRAVFAHDGTGMQPDRRTCRPRHHTFGSRHQNSLRHHRGDPCRYAGRCIADRERSDSRGQVSRIHQQQGEIRSLCAMRRGAGSGSPASAGHTTEEHGAQNAERQGRYVRQFHADVAEEQHQQPGCWKCEKRKRHSEHDQTLEKVTHCLVLHFLETAPTLPASLETPVSHRRSRPWRRVSPSTLVPTTRGG